MELNYNDIDSLDYGSSSNNDLNVRKQRMKSSSLDHSPRRRRSISRDNDHDRDGQYSRG